MDDKINYRKISPELQNCWFEYKNTKPYDLLSSASFVAGWNAAMDFLAKKNDAQEIVDALINKKKD